MYEDSIPPDLFTDENDCESKNTSEDPQLIGVAEIFVIAALIGVSGLAVAIAIRELFG